jgi:TolB-like protein/tRNA A-37 threonylcarbamoyl transferase component Bud32/Tfp pilus assembly protein PilF
MALQTGDRLGPYVIQSLLGMGGMGEVYRGRDTRLGRDVALKVISPARVSDQRLRRRFEKEARAASVLNHPSIVTVYDVGETDGVPWIAMEWVEGDTLRHALGAGPMPLRQVVQLTRQIADGLAVAHAKGIVHRDLKPANVMITPDGRAKILDFGLARQTAAVGGSDELLSQEDTLASPSEEVTREGTVLGTVGYMSPEQAAGRPVDFRSDQFSFGLIVYEMLSGRRAFDRQTPVETLAAVMRDEPPPLATLRPGLPPKLENMVARCLAKQPEERFASTRELAAALEAVSAGSLALDAPTASQVASPPGPRRAAVATIRRALVIGFPLALALGLAAAGVRYWAAPRAIQSIAVLPFENASKNADDDYLGDGLTDTLIHQLSGLRSLRVMARATVFRYKGTADPLRAARDLGVEAVLTGSVLRRGGQVSISAELVETKTGARLWGDRIDRSFADLVHVQDLLANGVANGLRLRLSPEDKLSLSRFGTDDSEAYDLVLHARQLFARDSEQDDREARRLYVQAIEKDPRFVEAYLGLAGTYARAASYGWLKPAEAWRLGAEALEKAKGIDPKHPLVQSTLVNRSFLSDWDWEAAERAYREMANDPRIFYGEQFRGMAIYLWARGRPEEAAALVERSLRTDPGNLESRINLADFLAHAGRLDESVAQYRAVIDTDPAYASPYYGLSQALKLRGDVTGAIESLKKAYELDDEERGTAALANARTAEELARAEATVTRARLADLEASARERYVSPLELARLHAQLGDRAQAFALLSEALAERSPMLVLLKADRAWDRIRDDPRFARLVAAVGIP